MCHCRKDGEKWFRLKKRKAGADELRCKGVFVNCGPIVEEQIPEVNLRWR